MDNSEIGLLLDIIDKRIRKVLKEEHLCYRYIAKVQTDFDANNNETTSFAPNVSTPVTLLGFEDTSNIIYHFLNRTNTTLTTGTWVYIDTMGNNLNSGVITQIYKYEAELFIK